jgi:hypothetical protein
VPAFPSSLPFVALHPLDIYQIQRRQVLRRPPSPFLPNALPPSTYVYLSQVNFY